MACLKDQLSDLYFSYDIFNHEKSDASYILYADDSTQLIADKN